MLTALKQLESIRSLEQMCFSGRVCITDSIHQWTLHLLDGHIAFVTGGVHSVRRWRRHLKSFCPDLPTYRLAWQIDLAKIDDAEFGFGWEYALLNQWVLQRKISTLQAHQMVNGIVADAIFDLVQASNLSIKTEPRDIGLMPLESVNTTTALAIAEQRWEKWQAIWLTQCLPHQSPVVKQVYQVKQISTMPEYQNLVERLDGQNTFLDLASEIRQDIISVASTLLPFVHSGWIDVVDVADLPTPIYRQRLFNRSVLPPPPPETHYKGALIACVDDSAFIRNTMEQMLTTAGYQFIGIEDPLRAIGTLLARKPDLIFLDLMMPQIGGHELCEKLRKLTCFKTTPIVILTGNDGFVNRLRSDFVGASDFLAKPLDAAVLLSVVHKHLAKGAHR